MKGGTGTKRLICFRHLQTLAEMLQKKRPPLTTLIDLILLHIYIRSHVAIPHSMTQTTFMTPNVDILPHSFLEGNFLLEIIMDIDRFLRIET